MNLTEIAKKYKTDKADNGYTPIYEKLFKDMRENEINLFEIGVLRGASLRAWNHFFQNGKIFGMDIFHRIEHKGVIDKLSKHDIKAFKADQSDKEELSRIMKECNVEFDIIIDDGSHWPDHNQISLGVLFPHVKSGGYYIIEDCVCSMDRQSRKLNIKDNHIYAEDIRNVCKHWNKKGTLGKTVLNKKESKYIENNVEEWYTTGGGNLSIIKKK